MENLGFGELKVDVRRADAMRRDMEVDCRVRKGEKSVGETIDGLSNSILGSKMGTYRNGGKTQQ